MSVTQTEASKSLERRSSAAPFAATDAWLRRCYGYLLPLREAWVPIARLSGPMQGSGRRGTLLVAGAPRWVSYLPNRIFAAPPTREVIGHAPVWALPRRLRELRGDADVTIARVDRISTRLWFDDDWLTVPEWIGSRIPLPIDVAALARESNSVAEDLRRTRLAGYTAEISHDAADLERFYREMLGPYIRARYGDEAYLPSIARLRAGFREGGLMWVLRDGARVAGHVYGRRGSGLTLIAIGAASLDAGLVGQGAMAAIYVLTLGYAMAQGCTEIDLRGMRPSLTDGLLRYKRKWGAVLYDRFDTPYSALVHWDRLDGAAHEFLTRVAPVFRVDDGLAAMAIVERATPWTSTALRAAHKALWAPGLTRLALLARPPLPADLPLPAATTALDLDALADGGPRALLAALRRAG
jgi:hypothetical protein